MREPVRGDTRRSYGTRKISMPIDATNKLFLKEHGKASPSLPFQVKRSSLTLDPHQSRGKPVIDLSLTIAATPD